MANIIPKYFIFDYSKPRRFKTLEDMQYYTSNMTHDILPGDGAVVDDTDPNTPGNQNQHFMWNKISWIPIGAPIISDYLNIYEITINKDSHGIEVINPSFFMRIQIQNIQSNIRLLSLLNKNYIIPNNEIITFAGLSGAYNLNNINTNNVITNMLSINLTSSLNHFLRKLCNQYEVPSLRFNEFIQSTIRSVNKIVTDTAYPFYQIAVNNPNIDLSIYFHYIASCFGAFDKVYKSFYNNNVTMTVLDPIDSLSIIDKPLVNRLRIKSQLSNDFDRLLKIIDDIIYRRPSNNNSTSNDLFNYFIELDKLVTYVLTNNPKLNNQRGKRDNFFTDLNDGIAGLVNLALFFSILSNSVYGTRTTLYFHFIAPRKYQHIY